MRNRTWLALTLAAACGPSAVTSTDAPADLTTPAVQHLVILLQENHTFDNYFGLYCAGPTGTPFPANCTGRGCCERAPQNVPGVDDIFGYARTCHAYSATSFLDDAYNNDGDPDHGANAEYAEMHNSGAPGSITGAFHMDRYYCNNVEYARFDASAAGWIWPDVPAADDSYPLRTYHSLAMGGALADRYFQPVVGASTSNDMFFARAAFVFQDNQRGLPFGGYADPTIGDLLEAAHVSWAVYMGGLDAGCSVTQFYPFCVDVTDDPYTFTAGHQSDRSTMRDLDQFNADLAAGTLPAVSLLRALGSNSEHAESYIGGGDITAGENNFIKPVIDAINASSYAPNTLILITFDEGGGWYDHVPPPMAMADGCALPTTPVWSGSTPPLGKNRCALIDSSTLPDGTVLPSSTSDPEYYSNPDSLNGQEYYGTRVPLLALGPYARKAQGGAVSHQVLEHSSIVKFIEWNWLGHRTGQLGTRDRHVNNLGSMLAPVLKVPSGVADR